LDISRTELYRNVPTNGTRSSNKFTTRTQSLSVALNPSNATHTRVCGLKRQQKKTSESYRNPALPHEWMALVANRCRGSLSDAAQQEIAHILWGFYKRKNHVADGLFKSISYQELYRRFGKFRGVGELIESGFFHVGRKWKKGCRTRKYGLTDYGRATLKHHRDQAAEFTPNHRTRKTPTTSFSSRDDNGNQCQAKYPINPLVPVDVEGLTELATDPDATDHEQTAAAQIVACADSDGCLIQKYIEHRGGRAFIHEAANLQNAPSGVRNCALAGFYDYDIVNAYPTIYGHVAERLNIITPHLNAYLKDKHELLNELADWMKCTPGQVKAAILALQHFAGVKGIIEATGKRSEPFTEAQAKRFLKHPKVKQLKDEFRKVGNAWIAEAKAKPGHRVVNEFGKGIERKAPPQKLISHLLQGVEAVIMEVCREYYASEIVLLMHDGFVSQSQINERWLEGKIRLATGYRITLKCTPIHCKNSGVKRNTPKPLQPAPTLRFNNDSVNYRTVKGLSVVGGGGVLGGGGVPVGVLDVGCVVD